MVALWRSPGARIRRIIVWTAISLLVLGGAGAGAATGAYYYKHHQGWYVGLVAVLAGVGAAFGAWFVASLLAMFVEIANSLGTLVDVALEDRGEG